MQVNSRNLAALGVTIEQVLDPCTNIRIGATILTAEYAEAVHSRGEGQPALKAALSAYNTGDFYRGFANGYVARYYGRDGVPVIAGTVREAATTVQVAQCKNIASRPIPTLPILASSRGSQSMSGSSSDGERGCLPCPCLLMRCCPTVSRTC